MQAILSRRLIIAEIEDVLAKVEQLSITAESAHVRLQCRQVRVTSCHVVSHHIASHRTTSYHIVSRHVTSCHIVALRVTLWHIVHFVSHRSLRVTSWHFVSHRSLCVTLHCITTSKCFIDYNSHSRVTSKY